jgi:hypothetical protein
MTDLDTVTLLREMKVRQRERGRFNYQRVAVDSLMAAGLLAVGWLGVKLGLGLYEFSKVVGDPAGAAADAARGIALAEQRVRLRALERRMGQEVQVRGLAREGSFAARYLGAPTLESVTANLRSEIALAEARIAELEEEEAVMDAGNPTPGIPLLRSLDRFLLLWGPVAPVAIMGGNITMEILRIRREREI